MLLLVTALTTSAFADAPGFDHWQQNDPSSTVVVDHQILDDLLARYLRLSPDGIHRFAYRIVDATDYTALTTYLMQLEQTIVTRLSTMEQLAYWINMYNALTVRVILDHYPVNSIREIGFGWPKWLKKGPWGEPLVVVEGATLSLDDIEHRIVRPIFGDTRVHYAFNCAAIGCPNLQPRAYTRDNLESVLENNAIDYINHPRGARFVGDTLVVSSLYTWYSEDFGTTTPAILEHLRKYAQPPLKRQLQQVDQIDDYFYDWSLNDG